MEFFQELTFTAFLALILSFVVAKIVTFAVSNSNNGGNASVSSSDEGTIAKEANLSKGLKVNRTKSKKRVKFVDDVVIRKVDPYEIEKGSENIEIFDKFESVVVGNEVDEKAIDGIDQALDNGLGEASGVNISKEDEGSEIIEMLVEEKIEGDKIDGGFVRKEEILVTDGLNRVVVEKSKNDVVLESGDREGNREVDFVPEEGLSSGDVDEEKRVKNDSGDDVNAEEKVREFLGDDDWEGIERSELEKVFAEAVNYLEYGVKSKEKGEDQLAELGSDVQMQLYGLHKVAVEGPCHEPQPMALKMAARAKWNAWQRLGSMSQEAAMEQYIEILSDSMPGWIHHQSDIETAGNAGSHLRSVIEDERKLDVNDSETGDSSTGPSSAEKVAMV